MESIELTLSSSIHDAAVAQLAAKQFRVIADIAITGQQAVDKDFDLRRIEVLARGLERAFSDYAATAERINLSPPN